jgi:soluble P-type ATPase
MIEVVIPGYRTLRLEYLVMDYNGTLAVDGVLLPGVAEGLARLKDKLAIHVATADTFGKAAAQLERLPCKLTVLGKENQDAGKLAFIRSLGAEAVAAIGNGRNDRMMLKESSLGIAVILEEGAALETLLSADIVCPSIPSALALLDNPLRMTATLRS